MNTEQLLKAAKAEINNRWQLDGKMTRSIVGIGFMQGVEWLLTHLQAQGDGELCPNIINHLASNLKDVYKSVEDNWTPAEIKPEHNVGVLVFIPGEDNHITSGMWDVSNKWVLLDEYRTVDDDAPVTHWMRLPANPKGFEGNELPDWFAATMKEIIAENNLNKKDGTVTHWLEEIPALATDGEAVGFAEWVAKKEFVNVYDNIWQNEIDMRMKSDAECDEPPTEFEVPQYTTQQLYMIYKNQTQPICQ